MSRRLTILITALLASINPLNAYLDTHDEVALFCDNSSVQWSWAMLSVLDHDFRGDERVLDVACRDGGVTAEIGRRVPQGSVTGIDVSPAAIAWAEENHAADNLLFIQADSKRIETAEEYDLVTGFLHLNRVSDLQPVIRNLYSALVPGGEAIFTVPIHPTRSKAGVKPPAELAPYLADVFPAVRRRTTDDYIHAAEAAGFEVVSADTTRASEVFADRNELEQWRIAVRPAMREWPVEILDLFFDFHLKQIEGLYPQRDDGRIYAFPTRLELKLRKPEEGEGTAIAKT